MVFLGHTMGLGVFFSMIFSLLRTSGLGLRVEARFFVLLSFLR